MKPMLHKIPAWQIEREKILQNACRSFEFRIGRVEKPCRASLRVARRYHGKPFKFDSAHKMALRPVTLRRLHRAWKLAGEVPSAFRLKYFAHRSAVSAALLVEFIHFCLTDYFPNLKRAWAAFTRRGDISYSKLRYIFPARKFYLLRERMEGVANAAHDLNGIIQTLVAEARERLPEPATNQSQTQNPK